MNIPNEVATVRSLEFLKFHTLKFRSPFTYEREFYGCPDDIKYLFDLLSKQRPRCFSRIEIHDELQRPIESLKLNILEKLSS